MARPDDPLRPGDLAEARIDATCWHPRMARKHGFRVPAGTVCLVVRTSGRHPRAVIDGRLCTIHPRDFRKIGGTKG
jgi:hypothetical protein